MVKLQKVHAYDYGGRSHYKYVITLREGLIERLKWESGSKLEANIQGDKIQISFVSKPVKNKKPKLPELKMSYTEFRDKIKLALEHKDNGMTWTELKESLGFEQVVPNNKWVRQLEVDIGLKRIRDANRIIWRVNHV